jgi:AraC family transcriptional regulator of adaptative response/methylated-DNA-[protein]-cysteine methyltransferase
MVPSQGEMNYQRIARAIEYLQTHFKEQPSLEKLAEVVHLSPFHFQRMFTAWAGTSPKKFLQYISVNYAKKLLKEQPLSVADAAFETGLSSTSRLHELFVNIEHLTPAEYKEGGKDLQVQYSFAEGCFGRMLVATTPKGICFLSFVDDEGVFHT